MRLGLLLPDGEEGFEDMAALARAAEDAGFDGLWVAGGHRLEPYTLLGALAARTTRVRLGVLVTELADRHPAVIAKQVTTLDVISRGRAVLGLGDGNGERLVEAMGICRAMFGDEQPAVAGRSYRVDGAANRPPPVRPGGPPVVVKGPGGVPAPALALADAVLLTADPGRISDEVEAVARLCTEAGRDPGTLTIEWAPPVSFDAVAGAVPSGVDGIILALGDQASIAGVASRFGRRIAGGLGPAEEPAEPPGEPPGGPGDDG